MVTVILTIRTSDVKIYKIIPYMYFITEIIIIVGEGVAVAVWSEDQF